MAAAKESNLQSVRKFRLEARATVETENWKLLRLFNYYRLAIGLSASAVAVTVGTVPPFGSAAPDLFAFAGLVYLAAGIAAMFAIHYRRPDFEAQATLLGFGDIALLTMLLHSSGGLGSGAEFLLMVAIAGLSLVLGKKTTTFYASIAVIAVLLQSGWGVLQALAGGSDTLGSDAFRDFPQAGLFGLGLYATALLGNTLAARLRQTEELAERRGADAANLAKLNDLIIQQLSAGAVVCDHAGNIRMVNRSAQRFLGINPAIRQYPPLSSLAPDLAIQLVQWLGNDPAQRQRRVVRSGRNYALLPRFVSLGDESEQAVLIFLEDMSVLKQQAQQLKMSALARLTASIAHEIRNPLGALSNAAQLLSESATGNEQEQRLVKIIEEQSKRMNVIVQNVTQLSRRDKTNPVRFSMDAWLVEFIRQYCETVFIPKETFTHQPSPGVNACFDVEQLYQVVSNLCQNALRASPPFTGTPQIKIQAGVDAENHPYVDVVDWGKGVAPQIADNIFDPFFTTTVKGTGLGLYIARELCEGNGGSLGYRQGEGSVGSIFRVTFIHTDECTELRTL